MDDDVERTGDGTATDPGDKYRHLPKPIRPEDMRTSHDVVPYGEPVGEADRERDWLLRTSGILI